MPICETCLHRNVCGKYKATGGVNKCEHHKEERHGRWEVKRIPILGVVEVKCPTCGWQDVDTYDAIVTYSDFNYCPNCGAKMDGGDNAVAIWNGWATERRSEGE